MAKLDEKKTADEQAEQKQVSVVKEENHSKKKGKGIIGIIFALLFLLLIVGMAVAILFFNAFNIRDKYLRGTIEKIPIVKNLLPTTVTTDENGNTIDNKELSKEELQSQIKELEKQIETQKTQITTLTDNTSALELENKRLQEIESQQVDFKNTKEEFDRLVALNDPAAYSAFYEQISPENASVLYAETKLSAEQKKELKKYTDTFANIDADAGAKIIEQLVDTDIDLVILILKNIDSEQRATIMAAMDPIKAAMVVKRMAPDTTGQ